VSVVELDVRKRHPVNQFQRIRSVLLDVEM
jgi:hypothetical protein